MVSFHAHGLLNTCFLSFNFGILTITALSCYEALEVSGGNLGVGSFKVSFIAGLIFGILLEMPKRLAFKNLNLNETAKNFIYFCQSSSIYFNAEQSFRAYNMLKVLNIFEGAMRIHLQSLSMYSGILLVQNIGNIINIYT